MTNPSLQPGFDMKDIDRRIDKFKNDKLKKMFEVLTYVGIQSVDHAKLAHTYEDQTGNLTSSIGYAVIVDGEIKKQHSSGEEEGAWEAKSLIIDMAEQYNVGMVLVLVAGMEYAAAVESMGYDVITSAAYEGADLMKILKLELGAVL